MGGLSNKQRGSNLSAGSTNCFYSNAHLTCTVIYYTATESKPISQQATLAWPLGTLQHSSCQLLPTKVKAARACLGSLKTVTSSEGSSTHMVPLPLPLTLSHAGLQRSRHALATLTNVGRHTASCGARWNCRSARRRMFARPESVWITETLPVHCSVVHKRGTAAAARGRTKLYMRCIRAPSACIWHPAYRCDSSAALCGSACTLQLSCVAADVSA